MKWGQASQVLLVLLQTRFQSQPLLPISLLARGLSPTSLCNSQSCSSEMLREAAGDSPHTSPHTESPESLLLPKPCLPPGMPPLIPLSFKTQFQGTSPDPDAMLG